MPANSSENKQLTQSKICFNVKFATNHKAKKHERKCKKTIGRTAKQKRSRRRRRPWKKKAEKEEGDDVEEAEEITYTSYRPAKLKYGKDYPDAVVENSTLSAVLPPDVTYNLAMPASILSEGKLSNL